MEHKQAKQMHAAEKYVLGELQGDLREQYEEHYFDCPECALDVQAASAFIAASKEVFLEKLQTTPVIEKKLKTSPWAGWLKPLIAVPALAALVVMLAYEMRHTQESIPETTGTERTLVASADFGLRGGDREASESTNVRVRAGDAFGLHFDFTPSQTFTKYRGEVQDLAGHSLMQVSIGAERINKEVKFVVGPGRLAAGNYALVIYGDPGAAGQAAKTVVAKYTFYLEIIP